MRWIVTIGEGNSAPYWDMEFADKEFEAGEDKVFGLPGTSDDNDEDTLTVSAYCQDL